MSFCTTAGHKFVAKIEPCEYDPYVPNSDQQQLGGAQDAGAGRGLIPEVESLRGIAITLVFWFHTLGWLTWYLPQGGLLMSAVQTVIRGGHTGVSLFFVLSGFLLSRPFLSEAAGQKRVKRSTYYARRALRILPLYWVAVAVATCVTAHQAADLLRGLPYLVFLNSIAGWAPPLDPYPFRIWWSLATEVQFYLLLPLLPLFLGSRRKRWIGSGILLAYVVAYAAFATGKLHLTTFQGQVWLGYSVFGRAPLFAFGIVAAWLCDRYGQRVRGWGARTVYVRNGGGDFALLLVFLGLGLLLHEVGAMSNMTVELRMHAWHVLEGALWTAVLLLLLVAPLRTKWLFSNPIWGRIGVLSFSIYLVHCPLLLLYLTGLRGLRALALLGWNMATLAAVLLFSAVCVGVSEITYRMIERPFLQRKARLGLWSARTTKAVWTDTHAVTPAAATDPASTPAPT